VSKIVAIAKVAGGTGKTTTAHALAVACVEYGKKVLLLDLDVST
jgi:cellulose biosynthesis protein BcsQ